MRTKNHEKGKKSNSSTRWIKRHISDPYVLMSKRDGYVSRSAYKLLSIQKKFGILRRGGAVLDLGAAPGGWTQVSVREVGRQGLVVSLDLLPMHSKIMQEHHVLADCRCEQSIPLLSSCLQSNGRKNVDTVLSDMAPNTSGINSMDHARSMLLCNRVTEIAEQLLSAGGNLAMKFFQGAEQNEFVASLRIKFCKVALFRPGASRPESKEMYIICTGYKKE